MKNSFCLATVGGALLLAACGGNVMPTGAVPPNQSAPTAGPLPAFTKPTDITNPYFPVSSIAQTVALGTEGGKSTREEVTLLPGTKVIAWAGGNTPARVTQFVAYSDGELVEVAYDYFAQADNGDVYYMGEDVANYQDGQVTNHGGSWLAGKDGAPPGLIMPAKPAVGMVFHPEDLPGVVYETDEVVSLSEKAMTPAGPITDGVFVKETMMEGDIEHKVWAAGYGIVQDQSGGETVDLVLASQADAAPGAIPDSLQTIEAQAEDIIDVVPGGNWTKVQDEVAAVAEAWQAYQGQAAAGGAAQGAPRAILDAFATALGRLQKTSSANDAPGTMQAANDVSADVMDLFSVYSPAVPVDVGRLDVFERQVVLDVAASDFSAAANSLARVDAIWARLKPLILQHDGVDVAAQFDASLDDQRAASNSKNGPEITAAANNGLQLVDALESLY